MHRGRITDTEQRTSQVHLFRNNANSYANKWSTCSPTPELTGCHVPTVAPVWSRHIKNDSNDNEHAWPSEDIQTSQPPDHIHESIHQVATPVFRILQSILSGIASFACHVTGAASPQSCSQASLLTPTESSLDSTGLMLHLAFRVTPRAETWSLADPRARNRCHTARSRTHTDLFF
jgi:hypothetical protein